MFQLIGVPQGIEQVPLQLKNTYKGICNWCKVVFTEGAPRSASKLSIDPIKSHASYIGKCTGSNKRSVTNNTML